MPPPPTRIKRQSNTQWLLFAMILFSASLDRRSENVRILAVIVSELEFGNVQWHVLAAHFVECTDDAALENRPEAFDSLRVDCADNIFTPRMVNCAMWEVFVEPFVSGPLIGAKQADFMGDGFANESVECCSLDVGHYTRHDVALTADCANDWCFAGTDTTSSTTPAAFIPMSIFRQAADESFIDFDDTAEFINVLHESGSDFVAHEPSGPVRSEAHIAIDLQSAHTFLARKHEMDHTEPLPQGFVRILENRSCDMGEAIVGGGRRAFVAQPVPLHCAVFLDLRVAATRARHAFWPTAASEVGATSIFIGESFFPLGDGHLVDWLGLFGAGHIGNPSLYRNQYGSFI